MKSIIAVGLFGLSLLFGSSALAAEAVPQVGQVVIESMGPSSGTIPKGKLAAMAKGTYKAAYKTKLVRK